MSQLPRSPGNRGPQQIFMVFFADKDERLRVKPGTKQSKIKQKAV